MFPFYGRGFALSGARTIWYGALPPRQPHFTGIWGGAGFVLW